MTWQIRYELLSNGRSIKIAYNYLSLVLAVLNFNEKNNSTPIQPINWFEFIPKQSELPQITTRLSEKEMDLLMGSLNRETPQV